MRNFRFQQAWASSSSVKCLLAPEMIYKQDRQVCSEQRLSLLDWIISDFGDWNWLCLVWLLTDELFTPSRSVYTSVSNMAIEQVQACKRSEFKRVLLSSWMWGQGMCQEDEWHNNPSNEKWLLISLLIIVVIDEDKGLGFSDLGFRISPSSCTWLAAVLFSSEFYL